jgi:hypothetical protein
MTRIHSSILVAALSLSTACAGLQPPTDLSVDRRLNVGNMGARNSFELRNGIGAGGSSDPAPTTKRPITPLLFWIGIGLTAAGGGTVLGSASAAAATRSQLRTAYDNGTTVQRVDELERRGSALNKVSLAGAVLMVAGAIMALSSYGYDYTRCGPLAPKRRRDTAPPGRCAAPDNK